MRRAINFDGPSRSDRQASENAGVGNLASVFDVEKHGDGSQRQGGDKHGAQSKNNHCPFPSYVIIMMPHYTGPRCLRMADLKQNRSEIIVPDGKLQFPSLTIENLLFSMAGLAAIADFRRGMRPDGVNFSESIYGL